jgi:hypothetical protein
MVYFPEANTRSYQELFLENLGTANTLFSQPLAHPEISAAEGQP